MTTYTQYKIITSVVIVGFTTSDVTDPADLNEHLREGWSITSHHVFCEAGRIIHTWSLSRTTTERDEATEPRFNYAEAFANIAQYPNVWDDDDDDSLPPDDTPTEADEDPAPAPLAAAVECYDAPPIATQAAFDPAGEFVPSVPTITIHATPPTSYREALAEMAAGRMTWQQVAQIGDAEALAAAAAAFQSRQQLYAQE